MKRVNLSLERREQLRLSLQIQRENNSNFGMKNKHHSKESKKKMSITRKILFKSGKLKNWCYGKILSEDHKKNISMGMKGKISPLKGRHISEDTRKKLIINHSGGRKKGSLVSEETRRKISNANKGKNLGNKHNLETINKIREARAKQILPTKDTSIEIKIQNFLTQLQIEYITHKYIHIEHGYQCDILIPSINTIIECFGDYWHNYPYGREIDSLRCQELREKGFRVLVFWEREINTMKLNYLKNKLHFRQKPVIKG